jgi:8-oxo-dGTP pyrophosphatase MutT (NUDIX family)
MIRDKLQALLEQYQPNNPTETACKQDMLTFLAEYPNCFERSLECGHFTASCWLLSKDGSHALLTHHAKLGFWVQLGGHCDGNPDVLEVAIKEAQEESGIMAIKPLSNHIFDIDIHLIPTRKKEPEHYHYDVRFLLQVTSDEEFVVSHESKELRWVSKDIKSLPAGSDSVLRMFKKWQELTL